tara:strand:+ start:21264 stop:22676 length:1413 start_codon:yes stop_codon:yes gene_type:complete
MADPTLVIKSNPATGSNVLIKDLGESVPSAGGSISIDTANRDLLRQAVESKRLRALVVDDFYGAGDSTLILNDGSVDIDQDKALDYLDSVLTPDASEDYGFLRRVATGEFDANSNSIINVPAPTNDLDAVNKAYVDLAVQGFDVKESVRVLSDSNVALSGTQTIDGVSTVAEDRVLLTGQTDPIENGIWLVKAAAWERPDDFLSGSNSAGAFTFVEEGTQYEDSGWLCVTDSPNDVVDTDPISFTQFTGAGQVFAGAGLVKTGNTISADFGLLGDLNEVGSSNSAGTIDKIARIDHVHAHGDRGADGAASQHDADQVDVEATLSRISAPGDAETIFSNINDNFGNPAYIGKVINFGLSRVVGLSGKRFLTTADGVYGSAAPVVMPRNGTITAATLKVDDTDPNDYNLSIKINGVEVASVTLTSGQTKVVNTGLSQAFAAEDELSCEMIRQGAGLRSDFQNITVIIEYKEG